MKYQNKTAMRKNIFRHIVLTCTVLLALNNSLLAQTDEDAIMMAKKQFCIGGMYNYSSWKNYWEGSLKRNNLNLGTVSNQMFGFMGTYGVSEKLNLLVNLPYVTTKATAGTLKGQHGLQDLSLWVKWMPLEIDLGKGTFSGYIIGGYSFPTTNYIADYLPLSIGLHSTNLSGRLLLDYQVGRFFATASGTYIYRNNITVDENAYYTTEQINSNKVFMPNVATEQLRTGYRSSHLIAEAIVSNSNTLGGFDIRRNVMPFPSNQMNATTVGVNVKYTLKAVSGLSLIGGGGYTVAGRNVGQSTMFNVGVFYILDFNHSDKKASTNAK
jgi:hypothetical protein